LEILSPPLPQLNEFSSPGASFDEAIVIYWQQNNKGRARIMPLARLNGINISYQVEGQGEPLVGNYLR